MVGALSDLAAHSGQPDDFTLTKGRKAWLRSDDVETNAFSGPAGGRTRSATRK